MIKNARGQKSGLNKKCDEKFHEIKIKIYEKLQLAYFDKAKKMV